MPGMPIGKTRYILALPSGMTWFFRMRVVHVGKPEIIYSSTEDFRNFLKGHGELFECSTSQ